MERASERNKSLKLINKEDIFIFNTKELLKINTVVYVYFLFPLL